MKADNTINGRTPEEIKKGLEYCPLCNKSCPYHNEKDCYEKLHYDTLALINQLQEDKKQLERERDAAVEQLTETSNEIGSCKGCIHYTNPGYKCYLWEANENCYEWRGVQEVE